ncbi:DNA-binding domain-containing protein [Fusibacter sp. 3D3]|uniref:DNA-binding domain-containing protein n=1 Tax=Fusibacter sp. 3D3 TaxID=1048380 RepID=UPI000853E4F7|nr:DNA-binding domain-containing protein [Fusibacter sp. 3D3]GAU79166.1 response regulator [Fusibacter sp. 3D3]
MRFYILDDDVNTVQMLSNLIEDLDLGTVVKTGTDPTVAEKEIRQYNVDICLVDYLMPKLDGSRLIRNVKAEADHIDFIMISQVSDPEMVSKSYLNGAEFFIHKPLNTVEFKKVVHHVIQKRQMVKKLDHIRQFLGEGVQMKSTTISVKQKFEQVFMTLGMMGEKGTNDLVRVCEALYHVEMLKEKAFNQWLSGSGERPKTVSQRMRRAMSKGLNNMAHLGIEDFGHETFVHYAYKLFDPQSIRAEMDFIKGKRKTGGKPNLFHFISCMIVEVGSHEQ